jgi:hypothetical protein
VGWSEGWAAVVGMEVNFQVGEERLGRVDEAVKVVPPAMAGQLVLQLAPQALDQVELRRIGRQEGKKGWNRSERRCQCARSAWRLW